MTGRIVVGIDGSHAAHRALEWAFDEADRRSADLTVVHAYTIFYWAPLGAPHSWEVAIERRATFQKELAAFQVAHPDVDVELLVIEGNPAGTLVDQSKAADLLVVGSRGSGGFGGLRIGSVSDQVVRHAVCPVVVIRTDVDEHNGASEPTRALDA
jgi:nucleotide-binding universal stress UspA family protein